MWNSIAGKSAQEYKKRNRLLVDENTCNYAGSSKLVLHRALLIFRLVLMELQIIPSSELKENTSVTITPKNT